MELGNSSGTSREGEKMCREVISVKQKEKK